MPLEEFWEGEASDETESEELPAEKNRSPRVMGKVLEKAFYVLIFLLPNPSVMDRRVFLLL